MISRLGMLFLGLLSLPLVASAAIVNIDYTAHIYSTTGDGLGYKQGDVIVGSNVIDTSKADGKFIDSPTEVWYYGSLWSGLLQSSFATPSSFGYLDFVRVSNDSTQNDKLILDKILNAADSTMESMGISFEFNGLDWISNLQLNNINLLSNEGGLSNGGFTRWSVDLSSNRWLITDSAYFWLDSVTITSSTTSVPEPAPLILLSTAIFGLLIRRQLN